MQRVALWARRLTRLQWWGLLVGAFVLFAEGRRMVEGKPVLASIAGLGALAFGGVAALVWTVERLSGAGAAAIAYLDRRWGSNPLPGTPGGSAWLGVSLFAGFAFGLVAFVTREPAALAATAALLALFLSYRATLRCPDGKARTVMATYTAATAFWGLLLMITVVARWKAGGQMSAGVLWLGSLLTAFALLAAPVARWLEARLRR